MIITAIFINPRNSLIKMGFEGIIDPRTDFLVVRHRYLNGNSYDTQKTIRDTVALSKHTAGRQVVTCLEGDLIQLSDTDEIVLTHKSFFPLTRASFRELRETQRAASFKGRFRQNCCLSRG